MGGYSISTNFLLKIATCAMRLWTYAGITFVTCFILYYLYGGLFAFLLLVFAATGILYNAEDKLLYHPELPSHSRVFVPIPSMYGLPYENVYVRTTDGILLHMFFVKQTPERMHLCPTIVFLHGNAGNMGHRLHNIVGLYNHLCCNILMLEYRGYGLSEGSPSEEGLYIDATTCLDYLSTRSDINHSEIVVFGRSLGGAVAIDLSCKPEYANKIWCLIVENTFTSIPEMGKVLLSWRMLQYLPLIFYKNKFLSMQKIKKLQVPTLFISGLSDTLVPPRMMSELHSRCASERKQLLQLTAGTHNETWTVQGYYHAINVFLNNCKLEHTMENTNENTPLLQHIKSKIHDV